MNLTPQDIGREVHKIPRQHFHRKLEIHVMLRERLDGGQCSYQTVIVQSPCLYFPWSYFPILQALASLVSIFLVLYWMDNAASFLFWLVAVITIGSCSWLEMEIGPPKLPSPLNPTTNPPQRIIATMSKFVFLPSSFLLY